MHLIRTILVSALIWEARFALRRHHPEIIAVTGSVGKTTTKDAIYAALAHTKHVRKSAKSFNSDIGVPLTILGLDNPWSSPWRWVVTLVRGAVVAFLSREYPSILVLEVGADRPGDIRSIARWLEPHVAVYTGVPAIPVHVEYFGSAEAVFREKRALAEHVRKGGAVIINADDSHAEELRSDFRGVATTYGFGEKADYLATHMETEYAGARPSGVRFRVDHGESSVPVVISGALGKPRVYAALAALAVAEHMGVDAVSASTALAAWEATPGRLRLIEGAHETTIIDDSYNSSPSAALAALDTLGELRAHRRIALLGDMLELGETSAKMHSDLAVDLQAQGFDKIYCAGKLMKNLHGALPENMRGAHAADAASLFALLGGVFEAGDVILIKGSHGSKMYKLAGDLLEKEKFKDAV